MNCFSLEFEIATHEGLNEVNLLFFYSFLPLQMRPKRERERERERASHMASLFNVNPDEFNLKSVTLANVSLQSHSIHFKVNLTCQFTRL